MYSPVVVFSLEALGPVANAKNAVGSEAGNFDPFGMLRRYGYRYGYLQVLDFSAYIVRLKSRVIDESPSPLFLARAPYA